jgi:histone-lysine N-methyltransferase EZH2
MKTCWEVFQYMNCSESKLSCQAGDGANSLVEGYSKVDLNGTMVSALLCLWCLA